MSPLFGKKEPVLVAGIRRMNEEKRPMLRLRIEVSIEPVDYQAGTGNLRLSEQLDIPATGFLEMARILGQFQELAAKFKRVPPA